jgi:hypothetical protein
MVDGMDDHNCRPGWVVVSDRKMTRREEMMGRRDDDDRGRRVH